MRKLCILLCILILASTSFTPVFAQDASTIIQPTISQYDGEISTTTQPITIQNATEMKRSFDKQKAANELYNAIIGYKQNKITKDQLDSLVNSYKSKYAYKASAQNNLQATQSVVPLGSDYVNLNYTCYQQQTSYYCGPASAYILLHGMGVTSYNGRTLSQDNLATDLGTTSSGTGFPGTWASTLNNWANTFLFGTTWAPSYTLSNWKTTYFVDAYVDVSTGGHGYVNDTHMVSGGYHLVGYNNGTEYWHYLCGDGVDQTVSPKKVHYEDSSYSTLYPSRYGPHWETSDNMATLTHDRGIAW